MTPRIETFTAEIDAVVARLDMERIMPGVLTDDGVLGCLPPRLRPRALATVMAFERAIPKLALSELIGLVTLAMGVVVAEYESR